MWFFIAHIGDLSLQSMKNLNRIDGSFWDALRVGVGRILYASILMCLLLAGGIVWAQVASASSAQQWFSFSLSLFRIRIAEGAPLQRIRNLEFTQKRQ